MTAAHTDATTRDIGLAIRDHLEARNVVLFGPTTPAR